MSVLRLDMHGFIKVVCHIADGDENNELSLNVKLLSELRTCSIERITRVVLSNTLVL